MIDKAMIRKFDIAGPRYTSYPTAPEWTSTVTDLTYRKKLEAFGQSHKTASIYIHIPFCQTMCTYCGCNVVIRKQEDKHGDQYLAYLLKEIDLVARFIGRKKKVMQLHWGGGTPTFLNEDQIERLFKKIRENFEVDMDSEVAIEIDPRTIDKSKLKKIKDLGFNRLSMGVQDFSDAVQRSVNRTQPFLCVQQFNDWCRELDFGSINFDLIYGLPKQSEASFQETVRQVIDLRPDRIALYSFAYVPWLKKHQNKINKDDLPSNDSKLSIFLNSRDQFLRNGYQAIAMDHFALEEDELAKAFNQGALYRNFMGYTTKPADEYIGLGVTSIGFLEDTFVQNHKVLPMYYKMLDENILPVERGKELSWDDKIRQWTINSLMCRFAVDKREFKNKFLVSFDEYFSVEQDHIKQCQQDGLLQDSQQRLDVLELGKIFIRNVCMGFDWYLRQSQGHKRFSRTV